ncbi:MAG: exodeoxyribonuclease V subunit beta [Acidobacteriota bacterium]
MSEASTQSGDHRVFDLLDSPLEAGSTLIEASAGTGKTYCLTGLVLRALLEGQVDGARQLLVVTFTNAATDELVGRIRTALTTAKDVFDGRRPAPDPFFQGLLDRHGGPSGRKVLRDALLDIDDLTVATIHGFCKRVLDEAAFEGGLPFDLDLVESDEDLWLNASRDVWRRLLASPEITGSALAALLAERRLEPGSFRDDYVEWRRHPRTRIAPEPLDVAEAVAQLDAARRAAKGRFDRVRWRLALSRVKFRAGQSLAEPQRLRSTLYAFATYLSTGQDGLWALESLAPSALRAAVDKASQPAHERLPGSAEVDRLHGAVEAVIHAVRFFVLEEVDHRFSTAKRRTATHAFDDLLRQLQSALAHPSHGRRLRRAVRGRYQMALIDEFQDTDLVQYDIFRRLFGDGPLILVGDPKQAIYRFRGADVFAYLGAKREADRRYTLNRNWRSGESLVAAVNAIFLGAERPFVEADIPYPEAEAAPAAAGRVLEGDGPASLIWHYLERESRTERAENRILGATAREVARLLSAGLDIGTTPSPGPSGSPAVVDSSDVSAIHARPLRPRDLAVLVRTNAQAQRMQERLRELGVPAVLGRSGDIYHSDELEECLRVLDAVLQPSHSGKLRAACSTVLWGDRAEDLQRLAHDDKAFAARVHAFDGYRRMWFEKGFIVMMETLLSEQKVRPRLAGLVRGERRLTNLQHAIELAHQADHEHHLSPASLVAWLRAQRQTPTYDRSAVELRLESDDEAVQLVTVHKSKGLEYEVVFCPFLWQARPVDREPVLVHESPERLVYDCGSERLGRHLQMAEAERLAEDLRLVYVALTRARRRCYVAWGPIGRGPRSAKSGLAWLLHRRQRAMGEVDSARRVADGLNEAADRADSWLADLRELVAEYPELMEVRPLDEDVEVESWRGDDELPLHFEAATLRPGVADLRQIPAWRIASFSSLTRGVAHEVPDRADLDSSPASRRRDPTPQGLFAFARGARAGDCLHRLLERLDFTRWRDAETVALVKQELDRARLSGAGSHAREAPPDYDPEKAVLEMVRRVMTCALPGGVRLEAVDRASRLVEWQFYAPLASNSPRHLASLFERHARSEWSEDYARRLAGLSEHSVEGFLTGFVDLVFEHRGRWYLIDWKSNHLGDHIEDYNQPAMHRAMAEHHYFLQAHLYAVALNRFLALHIPNWDYGEHFGGAYYLFLRGVDGDPGDGVPAPPSPPSPTRHGEADGDLGQLDLFGQPAVAPEAGISAPPAAAPQPGVVFIRPEVELIAALDTELLEAGVDDAG